MGFFDNQLKAIQNDIEYIKNDVLGIGAALKNSVGNKGQPGLPWTKGGNNESKSRFFQPISIDEARWNQLFPYRLLVVDAAKNHTIIGGGAIIKTTVSKPNGGSTASIITFEPVDNQWVFRLPISPQALNIQDTYAIQTSATLRGVMEEHSGVRFKLISASGTMGVWPYRESVTAPPSSPGLIRSLFGGTLESLGNVVNQIQGVINTATGGHPAAKPKTVSPKESNAGPSSTGYYQALALQQFLEQYAEAKKDPKNSTWRLVFDIPKQNQSFIVSPMMFTWKQNANKPMEIMYDLQLKAWRRIQLNSPAPATIDNAAISPGVLQQVLNTVTQARKVMAASMDLIGAVRSDARTPLEILRQTSLFVKDLAGVAFTAADLPSQIAQDYSSSIASAIANLDSASLSGDAASDPSVSSAISKMKQSFSQREGLSVDAVSTGQLGKQAQIAQSIDPSLNVLSNPDANFTLFNELPLDNLKLTAQQQATINALAEEARSTTVDDLKSYRAQMLELALQISNNFGAGDEYYNAVYNRPEPKERIQPLTLDEYDILKSIYDVVQSYDILTATTEVDDLKKKTNMEYVAGLADLSGIKFEDSTSKILVPVPFGLTIEEIALRYLGDAQRWLEIVTLNNLRDPYIDENGFQYELLSNATGRQITVGSQNNLYLGQRVVLRSATQPPVARRILGIDRLSDTSFLITLDGAPDLDGFTTVDQAYLQAYLPGTVNSQQKIFIPSDLPADSGPTIIQPASTQGDPLAGLSKVDWLLTESGDVARNSYGDFRLSAGMTNLIQALKTKIGSKKRTILAHPGFGLGIEPGVMNSDITAQQIFDDVNDLVKEDPRFQGVSSLQIELNGPKLVINMSVVIAGNQGVFPLTFEVAA